jgi:hypothetical protein
MLANVGYDGWRNRGSAAMKLILASIEANEENDINNESENIINGGYRNGSLAWRGGANIDNRRNVKAWRSQYG